MGGKTLTIIGIYFFVGGWMVENLFGIQFLCQGTQMACSVEYYSFLNFSCTSVMKSVRKK